MTEETISSNQNARNDVWIECVLPCFPSPKVDNSTDVLYDWEVGIDGSNESYCKNIIKVLCNREYGNILTMNADTGWCSR